MRLRIFNAIFAFALLCIGGFLARSGSGTGARPTIETAPTFEARSSIGSPFESLNRSELHDSFSEIHHGHRHAAIDIMRPRGTPVLAVTDGVIRKLFVSIAGGITIYEFDNSGKYCYFYAHLHNYAFGLHEGMRVARGEVIGFVGATGNASRSAPHLHFAISRLGPDKRYWKGEPIDPYPFLMQAVSAEKPDAKVVRQDRGLP